MLDWIKDNVASARKKLTEEMTKFKNREFMESVVAGCALVAAADGDISSEEKKKMMGFIQSSDELSVFKAEDVIESFQSTIKKFDFDADIGRAEALRTVAKIKGKDDAARLMVRVCCAIASSDGNFDDSEKVVIRNICNELGLNPGDFDL